MKYGTLAVTGCKSARKQEITFQASPISWTSNTQGNRWGTRNFQTSQTQPMIVELKVRKTQNQIIELNNWREPEQGVTNQLIESLSICIGSIWRVFWSGNNGFKVAFLLHFHFPKKNSIPVWMCEQFMSILSSGHPVDNPRKFPTVPDFEDIVRTRKMFLLDTCTASSRTGALWGWWWSERRGRRKQPWNGTIKYYIWIWKIFKKNLEGKFLLLNFLGRWTQKCVLHLYIVHVCQDIKIFIFHDSYPYQDIHNGILTSLMLRPMMESGSEPSAQVTWLGEGENILLRSEYVQQICCKLSDKSYIL